MLDAHVLDDVDAVAAHAGAWDALAVALGRPFCAPAWALGWWRHAAPHGALGLRPVVVTDGDEVIGVAPFFAQRKSPGRADLRLLGAHTSHRIAPLAAAGRE